jgi:hypothetical protein
MKKKKCAICSKVVDSSFRLIVNNVESVFCGIEHLIQFAELNYTNKGISAQMFSKKEEIKIGGGDVDPEYLDKVKKSESNPRECQGATSIDYNEKED